MSEPAIEASRLIIDLLDECLQNNHQIEVIDIAKEPYKAQENDVFATPTLVKYEPKPIRRVIGNLLNKNAIINDLLNGNCIS